MSESAGKRLLRGMAAAGFGQVVTVLVSLGSLPLFVLLLGKGGFEDWTLLGSLPMALAQTDLGFGMAATAEMTQRVARENRDGALKVFQSCWVLVTTISVIAFLLIFPFALWGPWYGWLKWSSVSEGEARLVFALLAAMILGQQQLSLIAAAYKSDGLYARVTMIENWMRLAQYAGGFLICLFSPSVLSFAIGFAGIYLAFTAYMAVDLRRQRPWLKWGFKEAGWSEIKPLIRPALSFAAYPLGISLNQQGFLWVINVALGPVQGYWSALRTLSRAVVQGAQIVIGPAPVEISAAVGRDDLPFARKLHHTVSQAGMLLALIGVAALLALGPFIFAFFTAGKYEFSYPLFILLLVAAFFNAAWNVSMSVAYAVNRHMGLTLGYIAINLICIGLGVFLAGFWGLIGVAVALALVDLIMAPLVISKALKILDESWDGYSKAMRQNPKELINRIKRGRAA